MLYLGIDQHAKQLTIDLSDEAGDLVLHRQVKTDWENLREFLDGLRKQADPVGGFMAIVEVCGRPSQICYFRQEWGCFLRSVLFHSARGSTPVGIIQSCIQFVVNANVSMRSVPRLFGILYGTLEPHSIVPGASSVRWWLLRLGLYTLREPLPQADDWIYIIDHSVQIGTVKVCLILGIRLRDLPYPQRALRHEDMRVIDVIPVQTSTGEIVAAQLEQASLRTGIPRQIVSDGGSDVKKGAKLFAHAHPSTAVTHDAAHHGAIVLKRCFENDAKWKGLRIGTPA